MTALVIAEHDNSSIKPATLNVVTAAVQCGGDVHVLVAGASAGAAAAAAAQISGVVGQEHCATCCCQTRRGTNLGHHQGGQP